MPDKKISELVNLTSLATDDEFVVVDKGANATKRITATNLNTGLNDIPDNKLVPDGGTIGSASDPDAMAISSGGDVTFSQDVIVSGGVFLGGTAAANELDDYEEGTFTVTITVNGTNGAVPSGGLYLATLNYRKVGTLVTVWGDLRQQCPTTTGDVGVTGTLPFVQATDRRVLLPVLASRALDIPDESVVLGTTYNSQSLAIFANNDSVGS